MFVEDFILVHAQQNIEQLNKVRFDILQYKSQHCIYNNTIQDVIYYTVLFYSILYYSILYYTICDIVYCIIYCSVLYNTVLYYTVSAPMVWCSHYAQQGVYTPESSIVH